MQKDAFIGFRCTQELKAEIEKLADNYNISMSNVITALCERSIDDFKLNYFDIDNKQVK